MYVFLSQLPCAPSRVPACLLKGAWVGIKTSHTLHVCRAKALAARHEALKNDLQRISRRKQVLACTHLQNSLLHASVLHGLVVLLFR